MPLSCCNPTDHEIFLDIDTSIQTLTDAVVDGSGSVGTSFSVAPNITVTVAGTAKQGLSAATPRGVMLSARLGNVGSVYIGGAGVTNDSGGARGIELGQLGMPSVVLPVENLNQIWVNADNAGDRVGVVIL